MKIYLCDLHLYCLRNLCLCGSQSLSCVMLNNYSDHQLSNFYSIYMYIQCHDIVVLLLPAVVYCCTTIIIKILLSTLIINVVNPFP